MVSQTYAPKRPKTEEVLTHELWFATCERITASRRNSAQNT
jgi:hypothetical protein